MIALFRDLAKPMFFLFLINFVYAENNGVGDEKWSFNTAIPVTATKVQYAVSFTDGNGNVHWDNNLTKNYTMVIPQALF